VSDEAARCSFYVRIQVTDEPTFRYAPVRLDSPMGHGYLVTVHPPMVGDLISLYDHQAHAGGAYRVIDRSWTHSSYGSANWPHVEDRPRVGPMLDVIVEAAEGPFVAQVASSEDEE
jgi:hypothetical protein